MLEGAAALLSFHCEESRRAGGRRVLWILRPRRIVLRPRFIGFRPCARMGNLGSTLDRRSKRRRSLPFGPRFAPKRHKQLRSAQSGSAAVMDRETDATPVAEASQPNG